MSFRKIFIYFIIFLAIAIGVVGFWYYQKGSFSKEILKLEILGPEEVELAQEIEYLIKYKNNGNVRLEEPILIFEYPENSLIEDGESRQEIKLDDIYPGQEKTFYFKGRLLGKEKESKTAKAWLSYMPKNLKARYESSTTFTTLIKSVPLTFEFDLPSKIEPDKDFRFRLNYFSSVDYPLSDLSIKLEYPEGFEFQEAIPRGLEQEIWEIALLNKTDGGRIEIGGKLLGDIGEQKIFKAKLGIWHEGEFVLLKESIRAIAINKASLYVSQQINGSPQYIANIGDQLHYEIFFKNIGEKALENIFLVITLEGEIFDFQTLKTASGDFKSGDNSIIWDWRDMPRLRFLDSQEEGEIEFWIKLRKDLEMEKIEDKNIEIKTKVYLDQVREEFITKVNSRLEIIQKGYFEDEVFGNSGPIPPEIGETTTYTIIWQVKNHYNDVKNVKVKTTLPMNVRLTGNIFPENQTSKFAFDFLSREIVWEIGDLEAGKGVLNPAPNIVFQVAFIPSSNQKGQIASIINETKISGEDQFTETTMESSIPSINTNLPDDSTITGQQGIIK